MGGSEHVGEKARSSGRPEHHELEPRSKLWIERGGKVALSDWRVALLEAIERTGSLSKAAEMMGSPYRSAWQRLKDSEDCLGIQLVTTHSGGVDGGRSALTEEARTLVRRYHEFADGLEELVDRRFNEAFGQASVLRGAPAGRRAKP